MSGDDGARLNNLISAPKKSANTQKSSASVGEKKLENGAKIISEINENSNEDLPSKSEEVLEENLFSTNEEENEINSKISNIIEENKENSILNYNLEEINSGFLEVKTSIEKLYQNVFNKNPNFKPTFNDVLGDVLAFIGGYSSINNFEEIYFKAFKINVEVFNGKYADMQAVPLVFKLSVWAKKNKGYDCVLDILNGIIRCLMGFNLDGEFSNVYSFLTKTIEYLSDENINF